MGSLVKKGGVLYYIIERPKFTDEEEKFIDAVLDAVTSKLSDSDISRIMLADEKKGRFLAEVGSLAQRNKIVVFPHERFLVKSKVEKIVDSYLGKTENRERLVDYLVDLLFGFGDITPLFLDPEIEEIMVNGEGLPVFVVHRKKGQCKTNIVIERRDVLEYLVSRFLLGGRVAGKNYIFDGTLQDGSRFNIVLPPSTRSPSIVVRRFTSRPFSILDLVKNKTMSSELAAFLWLAVEGLRVMPSNILIVGGAGSGKTTTLNTLAGFIPSDERIITIEDTPELDLGKRDNWLPLYTYHEPSGIDINLETLVKSSLRMRPDRIIVGEVRGSEAEDMFVAMDVGCSGSMGTLHANSAKEAVSRLTTHPMNVPESLIPLIDLVLVQQRLILPGKRVVRRVTEVVEIERMERINFNTIFRYNRENDSIVRSEIPPNLYDKLSKLAGMTKRDIMLEVDRRKRILENRINQGINQGTNNVYLELERDIHSEELSL